MSNEIAIRNSQDIEPVYATDPTGGRLAAWATSMVAAKQIANALCSTTFAPAHFRGKPDDGAAAIMFGDEVGFSPTQALRSIYVISGTPAMYARQMAALVLHHGHEVWTVEKSDAKVTVSGKRRGSEHTITDTWTTARAQKAGYASNKKYQSDPQAMLYARALADVCRQIAPDALAGLAYTVEEIEVTEPAQTVRVSRAKAPAEPMPEPELQPVKAVTSRKAAPAAEPEPDFDDEPADVTEPKPITPAQQKALHAGLNDAGLGEKVAALAFISDVLDREVESTKTLSADDASRCISELATMVEDPFVAPPADAA